MVAMDRLISLTVGTVGDDEYCATMQDVSELAVALGAKHDYVSLSAHAFDAAESDEDDELYYDDKTLEKVTNVLRSHGLSSQLVTDLISDLQNAGILFRERRPSREG
jgi:hypothetical protein